jgi:TPR repeat protein
MYLYNLDRDITQNKPTDVQMMMEWGYELPLFFQPLFSGNISIDGPIYNGTEGGLYSPAAPGIDACKNLYGFLEKHQDTLIENIPLFQETKAKIIRYLENKVVHSAFHLDAWDVFNMNDNGSEGNHTEQARELITNIQANNTAIAAAITADDPELLDKCPYFGQHGFRHFRQLLNEPVYQYGWAVLESVNFGEEELEVFTAGNLSGLKDAAGNEVVPAIYDEIYTFPYGSDRAVVIRQGLVGYINKAGKEVIPCTFDDAFDFDEDFAAVVADGKFGTITPEGVFRIPAVYEDGNILSADAISVKENGLWGIVDADGQGLLPFQDVKEIIGEPGPGFTYYNVVGHNGQETYYSHVFKPLTTGPAKSIDFFDNCYIIEKATGKGLVDENGNMLLNYEYPDIIVESALGVLIIKSTTGTGVYMPARGFILPCEYEEIISLKDAYPEPDGTRYAIVKQHKKTGLFAIGSRYEWIMPVSYQNFKWIKQGFLGFQKGKLWGLTDPSGKHLVEPRYKTLNNKFGSLSYGIALGFYEEGIDVITCDGNIRPMTSTEAYTEMNGYPQACYSKQEIQQLSTLSQLMEKAFNLLNEGVQYESQGGYGKALELFQDSAELGCVEAINNIGHIYEVAPEYEDHYKAFTYYSTAAEKGEVNAMANLALAYMYGRGTLADIPTAVSWLEKAVAKGNLYANMLLGDVYYIEQFNYTDLKMALDYYLEAQLYGHDAAASIGHIYELQEDYEQAVHYFQQALGSESAFAKWRLGCCYVNGTGVEIDLQQAMKLFLEAVEQQVEVHVDLAVLYMSDAFYNKDKARAHLDAAREAGVSSAEKYMKEFGFL